MGSCPVWSSSILPLNTHEGKLIKKEKFFLILSGCASAFIGIVYLRYFGFKNSLFRVDIPVYRPGQRHFQEIKSANRINEILGLMDWVILIATFIIIVLVIAIVVVSLLASIIRVKRVTLDTDVNEED